MTGEPDWCDACWGPVIPMAAWERWLSRICYWACIRWPTGRLFMTAPHRVMLPWAGNIAFRCHCRKPVVLNAAQGTEARRAETVQHGSVHESPVGNADAPNNSRGTVL